MKIRTQSALIKSLYHDFQFDKPTVDATMSRVDLKLLIKAVNFVQRYKPGDRSWLKAKIKEYNSQKVNRMPNYTEPSISPERARELRKTWSEPN